MKRPISFTQADRILAGTRQLPFLTALKEGTENELHLVILGAATEEGAEPGGSCGNPVLDRILADCKPVVPDPSREFEIIFEDYIIYQVRNESYGSFDELAEGTGTYLIRFKKSSFLDYLSVATDACRLEDGSFYPAPWKHYGICTQNHIVDVIAQEEPKVFYSGNT